MDLGLFPSSCLPVPICLSFLCLSEFYLVSSKSSPRYSSVDPIARCSDFVEVPNTSIISFETMVSDACLRKDEYLLYLGSCKTGHLPWVEDV